MPLAFIAAFCFILSYFFFLFRISPLILFSFAFHNKIMWIISIVIFNFQRLTYSVVISITVSLVICYISKSVSRVWVYKMKSYAIVMHSKIDLNYRFWNGNKNLQSFFRIFLPFFCCLSYGVNSIPYKRKYADCEKV